MKRTILSRAAPRLKAAFFAVFAAALFAVGSAALDMPSLDKADAACVYSIDNDKLLYMAGGDKTLAPASTVKLMTAVVAIDYYTKNDALDRNITISSVMLNEVTGNNIGLRVGETVTARQMISALVVGGSNDAAYALAVDSYGSSEAFVGAMNGLAAQLGMAGTYYTNPTGIDSEAMRTTLADTLIIALEAYRRNMFMELAGLTRYVMEPTDKSETRYIYNRNYMIATNNIADYYYKNATGMSSGMTEAGGWCLAATAREDGITHLAIVMGGEREQNEDGTYGKIYSYVNARKLLDWAFENFEYVRVLEVTTMICEIPVNFGRDVDHATLLPEKSLDLYLPSDVDMQNEIIMSWALEKPSLTAPVKAGEIAGLLTLYYKDEVVGRVNLLVKDNVELYGVLQLLNRLRGVVDSRPFRIIAAAAAFAAVVYVIVVATVRGRRKRRRFYRR